MKKNLVSIIMPVYNSSKYLKNALDSIIGQTYKNLEIILINDGSTDNSLEICKKYEKEDKRIVIVDKKNTGVSDSRNLGIDLARGEYIFFMDSDDWLENDAIESLLEIIIKQRVDIVKCNFYREQNGNKIENIYPQELLNKKIDTSESKKIIDYILSGKIEAYLWCLLIKKDIIKKYNIKFDIKLSMAEDTIWLLQLLINPTTIFIIDKYLYHYNINVKSISRNQMQIVKNLNYSLLIAKKEKDILKNKNLLTCFRKKIIEENTTGSIENYCYEMYQNNQMEELQEVINNIEIRKFLHQNKLYNKRIYVYIALKYIRKGKIKKLLKLYFFRKNIKKVLKEIKQFLVEVRETTKYKLKKKKKLKFYTDKEVVDLVLNTRKSIARYGDGEFKWLLNIEQESFQKQDKELSKRLKEVIMEDNNNLIIGIPYALNDLSQYNRNARFVWHVFINKLYDKIIRYINPKKTYCNTNITRPYIDYKNKKEAKQRFENIKRIWKDKDITIVEGEYTKIGVGNDLLNNAKSIRRIICPSKDAFSKYEHIYKETVKEDKNRIILLALGPTATVLASDLSKNGYQAIDIGHIDIEYEWFLANAKNKQKVKGKFVNEVSHEVEEIEINQKYENEIVKKVI